MDCGEKRLCGVRDNKGEDRVIAERLEWRGGKRKRLRWSRGRSARGWVFYEKSCVESRICNEVSW